MANPNYDNTNGYLKDISLTIKTVLSKKCKKLTIQDVTGAFDAVTNPGGYGAIPSTGDIQEILIKVYYPNITTPIIYTITQSANVVSALTVTDLDSVVHNIFSELSTIYVNGVFDLTGTEAIILPEIVDGFYNVEYTISGEAQDITELLVQFTHTTNSFFLSTCAIECCILNLYKKLDMCCDCSDSVLDKIRKSETLLTAAKYAVQVGQSEKAMCLLNKAKEICDGNCNNC